MGMGEMQKANRMAEFEPDCRLNKRNRARTELRHPTLDKVARDKVARI